MFFMGVFWKICLKSLEKREYLLLNNQQQKFSSMNFAQSNSDKLLLNLRAMKYSNFNFISCKFQSKNPFVSLTSKIPIRIRRLKPYLTQMTSSSQDSRCFIKPQFHSYIKFQHPYCRGQRTRNVNNRFHTNTETRE